MNDTPMFMNNRSLILLNAKMFKISKNSTQYTQACKKFINKKLWSSASGGKYFAHTRAKTNSLPLSIPKTEIILSIATKK